jgi:V/A-type H+/Na+-transporting ATPase subunit D
MIIDDLPKALARITASVMPTVTWPPRAAHAAARHAAARTALDRISTEITATRQRVRALQRHWIPALEQALTRAEFDLEEHELAEGVRRLRALSPA